MADLKIPYLKKNSDKFLFKKKLSYRSKSKRKLIKESFVMFSFSAFLIYIFYIIPNKSLIFNNFFNNVIQLKNLTLRSFTYFYEIFLVLFIIVSITFSIILIVGVISRIIKIIKKKSKQIKYE